MKRIALAIGISWFLAAGVVQAAPVFKGTLYYTTYLLSPNVWSVTYSYDQGTQALTLGVPTVVASLPDYGADGILFAPNGDLLVGGQETGKVYDVVVGSGAFTSVSPGTTGQSQNSYHLALDPLRTKFYTSNFSGPLDVVPLPFGTQGTTHAISGDEDGVTQVAFAPATGKVFYVNGPPDCCGNVGTINLSTGLTTQIFNALSQAHGIFYDAFTGLMTLTGGTGTATFDQNGGNLKVSGTLNGGGFDQGSLDGFGHAFVGGDGGLTFIDYSGSHDITNPDKVIINAIAGIDDTQIAETCTLSQGYWKNHASAWPSSCLPMQLGTSVTYSKSQLLSILGTPTRGDASLSLADQLIAANLNICNGSDPSPVLAVIADANALIGAGSIPEHVRSNTTLGKKMVADAAILNQFNNRVLTPGCTP